MGFLDRAKEAAQRVQSGARVAREQGQQRIEDLQARRQAELLLREVGLASYEEHRGEGGHEAVVRAVARLDEHVKAHNIDLSTSGVRGYLRTAAGAAGDTQPRDAAHAGNGKAPAPPDTPAGSTDTGSRPPDDAKAESSAGSAKAESAKAESGKAESSAGSAKPESAKAESGKAEAKAESGKADKPKAAKKTAATKSTTAKKTTAKKTSAAKKSTTKKTTTKKTQPSLDDESGGQS